MLINADFSKRVVIRPGDAPWTPSPMPRVDRRMLDRIGEEVARATTIVRYAPNSYFSAHTHGGGEEFVVLDGVFSDEHGDYGAGTYVRNPIGSRHTPFSKDGCVIFVKLQQFDPGDRRQAVIRPDPAAFVDGPAPGVTVLPLHEFGAEKVSFVRWAPGTGFTRRAHCGGEEILVLEGAFKDEYGEYPEGTWIRSPHDFEHAPASDEGCLIYVKTGHLKAA